MTDPAPAPAPGPDPQKVELPAPPPPDVSDGVEPGPDIDSEAGALPDDSGTPIVADPTPGGA